MARTAEIVGTRKGTGREAPARRIKVVVRRVDPWSTLKFSLLFYFCILLIVLFGLLILFWILSAIGVMKSLAEFIGGFQGDQDFQINGGWLFTRLFLVGILGVVAWSVINVCVAFLYNLVSDVVGGIELTLAEKR